MLTHVNTDCTNTYPVKDNDITDLLLVVDDWIAMYAVRGKLLGRLPVRHALQTVFKSSAAAEPFLNGSSSTYVEEMYESWKQDPSSVHRVSFIGR